MIGSLCCSYLRVYQAEDAFSAQERALMQRADRCWPTVGLGAGPASLSVLAADEQVEVRRIHRDGRLYLCPSWTGLRALEAIASARRTLPEPLLRMLTTPAALADVRRELERFTASHRDVKPCVLQEVWHVPPHWFACFDAGERVITHDERGARLRYETTMAEALDRMAVALESLQGGVHPAIVGAIAQLNEWLRRFDRRGVLELDYASVSQLFDAEELADDHSSADVWDGIRAVARGEGRQAAESYQRVTKRWAPRRFRQSLN